MFTKGKVAAILAILFLFNASTYADWQSFVAPPDQNKAGVPPLPADNDNSCWMATGANMLAAAGYGDGTSVSARALDVYREIVILEGGIANAGLTDDAINHWLASSNNHWLGNPYTSVASYSTQGVNRYEDPNALGFLGNKLRNGAMVGLGIIPAQTNPTSHAVTLWGDSGTGSFYGSGLNPNAVIITDSDRNVGASKYNASWDNTSRQWNITGLPYYDANGNSAYVSRAVTLEMARPFRWTVALDNNSYLGVTEPMFMAQSGTTTRLENFSVYLVRDNSAIDTVTGLDVTVASAGLRQLLTSTGLTTPSMTNANTLGNNLCLDSHFLVYNNDALVIQSQLFEDSDSMRIVAGFGIAGSPGWCRYQPVAEIVVPEHTVFTVSGRYATGEGTAGYVPFESLSAPEPATMSLLILGAITMMRRNRKR